MMEKKEIGEAGERAAREYLEKTGYRIVDTNFRTRTGEIDIIAYDSTVLVFVEVKTRRSKRFGTPAEAVDWKKQKKIKKTALTYLAKNRLFYGNIRFDIVEVVIEGSEIKKICLIKDAFQAVE